MDAARQRRNTAIFVALLILSGLLHIVFHYAPSYAFDIFMTCAMHAIFAGLIVYWMQTVRDRLVRSPSRGYTLAAGGMMLLLLLTRTLKYRIVINPILMRLFWYLYYVPMLMMPTLFLMTCVRFCRGRDTKPRELALLAPAVLLALAVLTNDLHHWVFISHVDPMTLQGERGTYSYGLVYWLIYVWIGLCIAAGIFFLLWKLSDLREWKRALWPALFLIAIPVVVSFNDTLWTHGFARIHEVPETHIFCMLGVYEACIRSRLMPRNENYPGFFAHLDMPVMITDAALRPVYQSSAPLCATQAQLCAALADPQALSEDARLYGRRLKGGCAFWVVDESTLHRLNSRLEEANETISLQNTLTQYEHEQQERRARIDARNAVYARAAKELYPVQKRIADLLDTIEPDTSEYRPLMARACALNAYVKRKTNFILTYGEGDEIDLEELYLAVREVAGFLNDCGLSASVERQRPVAMAYADVAALYDGFMLLAEAMLSRATRMMIYLRGDGLSVAVNGTLPEALPQMPCAMRLQCDDGLNYVTLTAKGGSGA